MYEFDLPENIDGEHFCYKFETYSEGLYGCSINYDLFAEIDSVQFINFETNEKYYISFIETTCRIETNDFTFLSELNKFISTLI